MHTIKYRYSNEKGQSQVAHSIMDDFHTQNSVWEEPDTHTQELYTTLLHLYEVDRIATAGGDGVGGAGDWEGEGFCHAVVFSCLIWWLNGDIHFAKKTPQIHTFILQ